MSDTPAWLPRLPHSKRLQKPLAGFVILCVLVSTLSLISHSAKRARQGFSSEDRWYDMTSPPVYLAQTAEPVADAVTRFTHPILVLQHDCRCKGLYLSEVDSYNNLASVSERQHREWAGAHGYVYRLSTGQYVPKEGWGGSDYLNKVWLALQIILEELEREDGVEWIMITDVDQIIVDPSIAPHYMLPSEDQNASFLITQDWNGFNSGLMFYRVSHLCATFLARVLAIEHSSVDPAADTQTSEESLGYLSDQRIIGLSLHRYKDMAEQTYLIPQDWFNAFVYPPDDPVAHGPEANLKDLHMYQSWTKDERIQLQAHLAGVVKTVVEWQGWPILADDVYRQGRAVAKERGIDGNGLDLLPSKRRAEEAAGQFWTQAKPGVEGMTVIGV